MTKPVNIRSLISKESPFFYISIIPWAFIWIEFAPIFAWGIFTWVPIFIAALILSLLLIPTPLKPLAIIVWTGPAVLLGLMLLANAMSITLKNHYSYYIGVDVNTPEGIATGIGMVEIIDDRLPWKSLGQFARSNVIIRGEAAYCDLGNGKNIIVTLIFNEDHTGTLLLPRLPLVSNHEGNAFQEKANPEDARKKRLPTDYTPILVSFNNILQHESMSIVSNENIHSILGIDHSIDKVWVQETNDEYKSSGILKRIPWIEKREKGVRLYNVSFGLAGLPTAFEPFIK